MSQIVLPKFIQEIIDDFNIVKVLEWIKEALYFFIFPIKFYKNFYTREYKQQIFQTVFYVALLISFTWLFYETFEIRDAYRSSFSIFLLTIPFFITNSLSLFIIDKRQFNLWKAFSFVFILWILYSIPAFAFIKLFATTENYSFYFIANVIFVIAYLLSLFLFWHIVLKKIRKIVFGYFLNIIFLNFSFVVFSLIFVDTYSRNQTFDPILDELTKSIEEINANKGLPYTYITQTNKRFNINEPKLSFIENDTVKYYNKKYIDEFRKMAHNNVIVLDSTYNKLNFKRNKEIISELSRYYKNINKYFDNPPCDTCLIEHVEYTFKKDSSLALVKKEYIIDQPYLESYKNFEKKVNDLYELNDFATSPYNIYEFLFKPIQLIIKIFNLETEEVNIIIPL